MIAEEKDLEEWVEHAGLQPGCCRCRVVEKVYGQYKDPDDEWKAIEAMCGSCENFGKE